MQKALDKLVAWANKCEIDLIVNKRRVMHIGEREKKMEFQYQMNDGWVKSVGEERDLEC